MEDKVPMLEFWVRYKSNGVPVDPPLPPIRAGIHAKFQCEADEYAGTLEDVKESVESCERWFNETKIASVELDEEGFTKDRKEVLTTKVKKVVTVWVEVNLDGVKKDDGYYQQLLKGDVCESEQPEATEESATSSAGKKSRKPVTTATE